MKTAATKRSDLNDLLVESAKEGDARAINKLCQANYSFVFNMLYFKCRNRELAEDLTQDVFVKMVNNLNQYSKTDFRFSSWLSSIVNSIFIDKVRRDKSRGEDKVSFTDFITSNSEESEDFGVARLTLNSHAELSVEEIYIHKEADNILYSDLAEAIESLDEEQKIVIKLSLDEENTYEDIVNETGFVLGTVKNLLFRARKQVAKYIIAKNVNKSGSRLTQMVCDMHFVDGIDLNNIANILNVNNEDINSIVKIGLTNIKSKVYADALIES